MTDQRARRAEDIACRTKRFYTTHRLAKQARKRQRGQGLRDLVIYRCWHCHQFHLGNPPGRQTYVRPGNPPIAPEESA